MRRANGLALVTVVTALAVLASSRSWADAASQIECRPGATGMARVELFFGAPDGTQRAWRRFVRTIVTPRFPDGLTSTEGAGQWRRRGRVLRERTHVLFIYYRPTAASDARIEEIRTAYKRRFHQASILRADSVACVSF